MKGRRQDKILELISTYEITTQEELADRLQAEGFRVTQATVSRDIRELHLFKEVASNRYMDAFRAGFVSMKMAQNILVIRTVSGMAGSVAAALDAMDFTEIVGSIAGDDTIMCAIGSVEETKSLMEKIEAVL